MQFVAVDVANEVLSDVHSAVWANADKKSVPLIPTPLNGNPAIKKISPFIEKSTDHGTVHALSVAAAHNRNIVAVHLSWQSEKHDTMADLDQFVDGVAVMFPLTAQASAFTMGSDDDPVNAWYWKANLDDRAFDVVAHGYGTSQRHPESAQPISCSAAHVDQKWHVVLSRALGTPDGRASLLPGNPTRVSFAVWDGGNRERAGRKSFSGDFVAAEIHP